MPSAHDNRAGASGEVDVADDGTDAAGGVAASEWLAANLGGGAFDTGGTGARKSAKDDPRLYPGPPLGQREDTAYD